MYKIETIENQRKIWLPLNEITSTIFYNQRVIVSAPIPEPITWRITKVENSAPLGINKITLAQDLFDQHKDYIEKDEFGNVIAMWADYYSSFVEPEVEHKDFNITDYGIISINGIKNQIKVGGNERIFTINYYDVNGNPIEHEVGEWSFTIDGNACDSEIEVVKNTEDDSLNSNQIKVKFIGSDDYIGSILNLKNVSEKITAELNVEIVGL